MADMHVLTGSNTRHWRSKTLRTLVLLLVAGLTGWSYGQQARENTLATLPQLPIDHPSSGLWGAHINKPETDDYLRITRVGSFTVMSSPGLIEAICQAVVRANTLRDDDAEVTMAIEYNPYHRHYAGMRNPMLTGWLERAEHEFQERTFALAAQIIKKYGLTLEYVLLDSELFWAHPTRPDWSLAILKKHRASYAIAMRHFPQARVVWYGMGSVGPHGRDAPVGSDYNDWRIRTGTTGMEPGADVLNPILYYGADLGENRQRLAATTRFGRMTHRLRVVPCLSLGAGWRIKRGRHVWDHAWDYDRAVSHELGRLINRDRPVPWDVEAIWLYPQPQRTETTWAHFVAYCEGAAGKALRE